MNAKRMLLAILGTTLGGAVLAAQPPNEIDAHISAARTAAGQDYRATFVNLCFAGGGPGPANAGARAGGPGAANAGARAGGPGAAPRGAGAGAGTTPDRANWYASPYKVFDNLYWLG